MKGILFTWDEGRQSAFVPLGAPYAVSRPDVILAIGGGIKVRLIAKVGKWDALRSALASALADQEERVFPLDDFVDLANCQID